MPKRTLSEADKEVLRKEKINSRLVLLFVLTLASFLAAVFSFNLLIRIQKLPELSIIKNSWIMWCWLPIPVLSIVLGFRYKKQGYQCLKNIVGGFIVGGLLVVYGAIGLFSDYSEDYRKIEAYSSVTDAELPENGQLTILNFKKENITDARISGYTMVRAYYGEENVDQLEKSIENSDKWILGKILKSDLRIWITTWMTDDDKAYYSFYNKTTGQYNTLPEKSGSYEIYAMVYQKEEKRLEIHKFQYAYQK